MFALPGILALIFFIYVRPQEIFTDLQRLPLLYLFFGLSIFGLAVDLKTRVNKAEPVPQLLWVVLLFVWSVATVAAKAPDQLIHESLDFAVSITLFVVLAHSVNSFRGFQVVTGLVLALVMGLSALGIEQGVAAYGCVKIDPGSGGDITVGVPDGRPCRPLEDLDCYLRGEPDPGADYICEHIGLLKTTSVNGRVRYRGVLQDPNELALALGIGLAFAFALADRRRGMRRWLLALGAVGLVLACVYFTRSRGGQLVVAAVFGVYAVWRWRWKAVAVMLIVAPIALLFLAGGGEGRADAVQLTEERMEAWMTGLQLFRSSPIFGVGHGQFVAHHYLTAHNSYILSLAETGAIGFLLWSAVLYLSVKIPVVAAFRYHKVPEARVAWVWAMALVASMAGLIVGILFLSFAWHYVFWIYAGLSGAYYSAVRTHDPEFRITMRLWDWVGVASGGVALMACLYVYLRLKGF